MITIRTAVLKDCPHKDERDHGQLAISLPFDAPELHVLGEQVEALCKEPVTHEDFTRAVLAILPAGASVATSWKTGRWDIECTEGGEGVDLLRESVDSAGA
jgi:hypothetical protein